MKLLSGVLVSCVGLLLLGCASPPEIKPTAGLPPPPPVTNDGYTIRAGDLLTISIADEPELTQQVRVDWNGKIFVPALGSGEGDAGIVAAGRSPAELAARLSEFVKKNKMLVNARAQVLVSEYAGQAYAVLGQVAQPGRYTFPRGVPPRLPIEEAIALAGGYTRLARQSRVLVKRGSQGVYAVDLEKLATQPDQPSAIIIPGDVITVTERRF